MIVTIAFLLSMQAAPASGIAHGPKAHGTAASLFSVNDYPAKAVGTGAHGKVDVQLTIDKTGRVSGCAVTHSSGSSLLDTATCQVLRRRAHYAPAIDELGQPIVSATNDEIVWIVP